MHDTTGSSDLPPVILVERRRNPDRRTGWRGGRRNTDWINRPVGAWPHLTRREAPWRLWLARLAEGSG